MVVGYKPNSEKKLKDLDYVFAGAASGFITRSLFQPLDVVKIRFQLQVEPIRACKHGTSKYHGIRQAIRSIRKEEGFRAFWKGTTPAQILSVSYGGLQFLSFEFLTEEAFDLLPENIYDKGKPFINFTCGALSGGIATTGSLPFDVIRTRLVAQGEPKIYRGMFHAAFLMWHREGFSSFYKGLVPTLIQIMPNTGAQFAFYKLFQEIWATSLQGVISNSTAVQSSFCGAGAGMVAKTIVYPLDLIKKRIQIQGFEKARKNFGVFRSYSGLVHCFWSIIAEEGPLGLYKGLGPSVLKAALTTSSHFLFYEEILGFITEFR